MSLRLCLIFFLPLLGDAYQTGVAGMDIGQ
jgi:hypothetical protein